MRKEIIILLVLIILGTFGTVHASSVSASFNIINSTSPINGEVYFNVSANFPTQTNYVVFLNKTAAINGTIPANSTRFYLIGYNVSNMNYGMYYSKVYFSTLNLTLDSSNKLYISPTSRFIFINPEKTIEINGNYSLLDININNAGNTPIRINWSLPILKNISISIDFRQTFSLLPGENKSIAINLTLEKSYQDNISFGFTGSYLNYTKTLVYRTILIKPYVNMSFYGSNITSVNSTRQLWISRIKNYNNVPVNLLLKFTLKVNDSTLYYTKSYTLPVNATEIAVYLPNSTIENVQVSYEGNNLSKVTESVFSAPVSPLKISFSYIINTLGYVIFTALAVLILVLIHIRFRKKGAKRKNGNNK